MDHRAIVTIDPERRFGKPCVRNTRMAVYDMLGWLAAGMTGPGIMEDFLPLTEGEYPPCLACAFMGDAMPAAPDQLVRSNRA